MVRQLAGTVHFTTTFGVVSPADVAENCTAVTATPCGTENTTQPRSHCPGDSDDRFDPSSDSDASAPPNWEPVAPDDTDADDPLASNAEKSSSSAPVCEPCGPAHTVASMASHTRPADGVFGYGDVSVTPGYQADTCTLVIPPIVAGIATFVPNGYTPFGAALDDVAGVEVPDVTPPGADDEPVGRTADPDVTDVDPHAAASPPTTTAATTAIRDPTTSHLQF